MNQPADLHRQLEALTRATWGDAQERDRAIGYALDLMQALGAEGAGLADLVARYADSPSPVALRPLTFFLARAGDAAQPQQTRQLAQEVAGQLACDDGAALGNLLTCFLRLDMQGAALHAGQAHPSLVALLLRALDSGHGDAQAVALDLVARFWEQGLLQSAFAPDQQAALRQRVARLAAHSQDEQVKLALEGLEPLYQSPRGPDV